MSLRLLYQVQHEKDLILSIPLSEFSVPLAGIITVGPELINGTKFDMDLQANISLAADWKSPIVRFTVLKTQDPSAGDDAAERSDSELGEFSVTIMIALKLSDVDLKGASKYIRYLAPNLGLQTLSGRSMLLFCPQRQCVRSLHF